MRQFNRSTRLNVCAREKRGQICRVKSAKHSKKEITSPAAAMTFAFSESDGDDVNVEEDDDDVTPSLLGFPHVPS